MTRTIKCIYIIYRVWAEGMCALEAMQTDMMVVVVVVFAINQWYIVSQKLQY